MFTLAKLKHWSTRHFWQLLKTNKIVRQQNSRTQRGQAKSSCTRKNSAVHAIEKTLGSKNHCKWDRCKQNDAYPESKKTWGGWKQKQFCVHVGGQTQEYHSRHGKSPSQMPWENTNSPYSLGHLKELRLGKRAVTSVQERWVEDSKLQIRLICYKVITLNRIRAVNISVTWK